MVSMQSLPQGYRAIVFGATGGIGAAFHQHLKQDINCREVIGLSRSSEPAFDLENEVSIRNAADTLVGEFHLLIDATGFLSDATIAPEKSLRALNAQAMAKLYELNTIGPSLLMKHFSKHMPRKERAIFATLSARVGSIGDNRLGGWYAYRAAKTALNMMMKCSAIEVARTKPESVFVSLHPGTVDTSLSDPFAGSRERLAPEQSAEMLLKVIDDLGPQESGSFWDYKGNRVEW